MPALIFYLILGYFGFQYFFGDESGCDKYASKYSCSYVEEKASYNVYYWHQVHKGDPNDELYIGTVKGLSACRNLAVNYSLSINSQWNNRSYICILMKDGMSMEKHQL